MQGTISTFLSRHFIYLYIYCELRNIHGEAGILVLGVKLSFCNREVG